MDLISKITIFLIFTSAILIVVVRSSENKFPEKIYLSSVQKSNTSNGTQLPSSNLESIISYDKKLDAILVQSAQYWSFASTVDASIYEFQSKRLNWLKDDAFPRATKVLDLMQYNKPEEVAQFLLSFQSQKARDKEEERKLIDQMTQGKLLEYNLYQNKDLTNEAIQAMLKADQVLSKYGVFIISKDEESSIFDMSVLTPLADVFKKYEDCVLKKGASFINSIDEKAARCLNLWMNIEKYIRRYGHIYKYFAANTIKKINFFHDFNHEMAKEREKKVAKFQAIREESDRYQNKLNLLMAGISEMINRFAEAELNYLNPNKSQLEVTVNVL